MGGPNIIMNWKCIKGDFQIKEWHRENNSHHITNISDCLLVEESENFMKNHLLSTLGCVNSNIFIATIRFCHPSLEADIDNM